jgi:hypothetical protein
MGLTNMEIKMTPDEIMIAAIALEVKVSEKGYYMPKVTSYIRWLGYDLTINLEYRTAAGESTKDQFYHGNMDEGFEVLFARANSFADNLPSIQEAKRNDFIASLGRIIDKGREIGIEVDFLNPLTEMMGKLSANIIEHKE